MNRNHENTGTTRSRSESRKYRPRNVIGIGSLALVMAVGAKFGVQALSDHEQAQGHPDAVVTLEIDGNQRQQMDATAQQAAKEIVNTQPGMLAEHSIAVENGNLVVSEKELHDGTGGQGTYNTDIRLEFGGAPASTDIADVESFLDTNPQLRQAESRYSKSYEDVVTSVGISDPDQDGIANLVMTFPEEGDYLFDTLPHKFYESSSQEQAAYIASGFGPYGPDKP